MCFQKGIVSHGCMYSAYEGTTTATTTKNETFLKLLSVNLSSDAVLIDYIAIS